MHKQRYLSVQILEINITKTTNIHLSVRFFSDLKQHG
jgi:hypothetical protein